jgi:hypothetical protein
MTKVETHHKPINAGTTTNFIPNHPTEHNIAAHNYFITCMQAFTPTLTRLGGIYIYTHTYIEG